MYVVSGYYPRSETVYHFQTINSENAEKLATKMVEDKVQDVNIHYLNFSSDYGTGAEIALENPPRFD